LAILAVVACVVAGCSSSKKDDSTASGGSGSVKTSGAAVDKGGPGSTGGGSASGGACAGLTAGKDGVIRLWCDGTAKVTFDVGGTKGEIDGGTCSTEGGYFGVNAGVNIGPDFTGKKPDYAGFLMPTADGAFSGQSIVASVNTGGAGYAIMQVTGTHGAKSGSLKGTTYGANKPVTASFTC
jgi:hypothetical protein